MEVESEGKLPDSRTHIYAVSITREETITIHDHILRELLDHRKSKSSRKTSISALLTMPKPLTNYNKLENSERDGNTRSPDLPLEKFVCRSGSNS